MVSVCLHNQMYSVISWKYLITFLQDSLVSFLKVSYNHTFPEYLISTILQPRRIYRHTHRPRKRKIAPKQPLLLSPVVRLITPPCYPLRIHCSTTTNPPNSNFGERDVRRLARCFCFILNFVLIFAEFQTCNIFKYFSFHYLFILLRI